MQSVSLRDENIDEGEEHVVGYEGLGWPRNGVTESNEEGFFQLCPCWLWKLGGTLNSRRATGSQPCRLEESISWLNSI